MTLFRITVYGSAPGKRGQRTVIHNRQVEVDGPEGYVKALKDVLPPAANFDAFAGVSAMRVPTKTETAPTPVKWK